MKTLSRVYDSYAQARAAVDAVKRRACPPPTSASSPTSMSAPSMPTSTRSPDAAKGAGIGGALGGGAGLLAGLGLLAIPGLGPVVAAGWLAPPPSAPPPARRRAVSWGRWSTPASTGSMPTSTPSWSAAAARMVTYGRATRRPAGSHALLDDLQADRSGRARRRVPQDRLADVRREGPALPAEPGRDRPHAGELAGLRTARTRTRAGRTACPSSFDPHRPFNSEPAPA